MHSYLTHLECGRCATRYTPEGLHNLCGCGGPLLAAYDLAEISRVVSREDLGFRVHSMWRFHELLPVRDPSHIVTAFEGFTPLLSGAALGAHIGLSSLFFKDESFNPTASFKARGLCAAVSRAKELGVKEIALPTAGNAGSAAAAYAARGGLKCHVFMPFDTPEIFATECRALGADVRMVDGYITDAGNEMRVHQKQYGWYDVSTFREPYRVEGKKTILLELAQQFGWNLPDAILFPTGGGTGIVAAWKACMELKELGWLNRFRMPKLIAVQSDGCAPVVRAWQNNLDDAPEWQNPETHASGLRVPKTIGDFMILRAIRDSGGTAVAVSEEEIEDWRLRLGAMEGIFTAPEAAAAVAALPHLVSSGVIHPEEKLVVLLTGSGLKYPMKEF